MKYIAPISYKVFPIVIYGIDFIPIVKCLLLKVIENALVTKTKSLQLYIKTDTVRKHFIKKAYRG